VVSVGYKSLVVVVHIVLKLEEATPDSNVQYDAKQHQNNVANKRDNVVMSVTQDGEHDPVHTKKHVHESQSCYVKRSALLITSGTFQKVRNSNQY
jgi:hypothetical protein